MKINERNRLGGVVDIGCVDYEDEGDYWYSGSMDFEQDIDPNEMVDLVMLDIEKFYAMYETKADNGVVLDIPWVSEAGIAVKTGTLEEMKNALDDACRIAFKIAPGFALIIDPLNTLVT